MAWRKLDVLRYVDRVCISLSTLNPALQNLMCETPNAFEYALRSIELLKKKKIGVTVSILISGLNLDEAPVMIEYFGKRRIPVVLSLYNDISLQNSLVKIGIHNDQYQIQIHALLKFIRKLRVLKKKFPVYLDAKTINSIEKLCLEGVRNWRCGSFSSFFMVNEKGYVSGCHVMPPLCKIWELPKFWEDEKMEQLRRTYSLCEKCTYLCYIAYSHLKNIQNLFEYFLEYEIRKLQSFLGWKEID